MTVMTPYEVGQTMFTIDTETMKVKKFDVESISTFTTAEKTEVYLYPKDSYTSIPARKCFHTEQELLNHLCGDLCGDADPASRPIA